MKFQLTHRSEIITHGNRHGDRRLILLFAGWAQSAAVARGVSMPGYDIAVVWDYRSMDAPRADVLEKYDEIAVVAWSFGVHAAARFVTSMGVERFNSLIAVNGTRFTADDTRGIAPDIFHATLAGLNPKNLERFKMRMHGGARAYREYQASAVSSEANDKETDRSIEEVGEELAAFDTEPAPRLLWDKAFIGRDDLIILPANQHRAWAGEAVEVIDIEGPHVPDFNMILRRSFTDKSQVATRFERARATYDLHAAPQHRAAATLLDLAKVFVDDKPQRMLEIGCGTGSLTTAALDLWHPGEILLWDLHISPELDTLLKNHLECNISFTECDAESEMRNLDPDSLDMIISTSTVQWFNSLRAFLKQASRTLRKGGWIVISTYGPATMREVHATLDTRSRFAGMDAVSRAIPEDFEIVHFSDEIITQTFDSPMEVLRHMSHTGVNGLTDNGTERNAAARQLLRAYPTAIDGKAQLTFNPIYLILKKS